MKRFLSLMLSVVMLSLLVASAMPVFAADNTTPFTVNGNAYETLAEAVANANANDIITLTADYETTDDVNITVDKALTIKSAEGNKFKITVNGIEGANKRWINSTANLIIQNIDLTLNQGIGATNNELKIENSVVDMTIAYGTKEETRGAFSFLRIDGAKVTLSETTVSYNSPNVASDGKDGIMAHPVYIRGTESTLVLENDSSIKTTSKVRLNTHANTVVFVDYADGSSNSKKLTVNILVLN